MDKTSLIESARTPLSIIAIFSTVSEVAMTYALSHVDKEMQPVFIWFVMGYPVLLVCLFFFTLYTKPAVLFSPSDYEKDTSYLSSINQRKNMDEISSQISDLNETNKTLMNYLEAVVQNVAPEKSLEIISAEKKRLKGAHYLGQFEKIGIIQFLMDELELNIEFVEQLIADTIDFSELPDKILAHTGSKSKSERMYRLITNFPKSRTDFSNAKELIGRIK